MIKIKKKMEHFFEILLILTFYAIRHRYVNLCLCHNVHIFYCKNFDFLTLFIIGFKANYKNIVIQFCKASILMKFNSFSTPFQTPEVI